MGYGTCHIVVGHLIFWGSGNVSRPSSNVIMIQAKDWDRSAHRSHISGATAKARIEIPRSFDKSETTSWCLVMFRQRPVSRGTIVRRYYCRLHSVLLGSTAKECSKNAGGKFSNHHTLLVTNGWLTSRSIHDLRCLTIIIEKPSSWSATFFKTCATSCSFGYIYLFRDHSLPGRMGNHSTTLNIWQNP